MTSAKKSEERHLLLASKTNNRHRYVRAATEVTKANNIVRGGIHQLAGTSKKKKATS